MSFQISGEKFVVMGYRAGVRRHSIRVQQTRRDADANADGNRSREIPNRPEKTSSGLISNIADSMLFIEQSDSTEVETRFVGIPMASRLPSVGIGLARDPRIHRAPSWWQCDVGDRGWGRSIDGVSNGPRNSADGSRAPIGTSRILEGG